MARWISYVFRHSRSVEWTPSPWEQLCWSPLLPPFPQRIGTGKNKYNRIETRQRIGNEETTLYSRFIDSILTTSLRESGCHSVYRKMRLERWSNLFRVTQLWDSPLGKFNSRVRICSFCCAPGLLRYVSCHRRPFPHGPHGPPGLVRHDIECSLQGRPSSNLYWITRRMKQLLNQVKCRCRRHFGVPNRDCRSPGMGRVVKKGSRALEGVQLILEEGNDLGSRWGWTASQRSDMPRTCQVTWGLWVHWSIRFLSGGRRGKERSIPVQTW